MTLNPERAKNKFQLIKENWSNYLINSIATIALIYLILLFAPMWSGMSVYWFYVDSNPRTLGEIICFLPPVIALLSLIFWFVFGIWRYKAHWLRLILMPLMIGCCLTYFFLIFFIPASSQHLDEVRQGINLYRATLWNTDSSGGSYNILFRCDPLGVLCSEICSMSIDNVRTLQRQIHISIDDTTQTAMLMDGNTELCRTGNNS